MPPAAVSERVKPHLQRHASIRRFCEIFISGNTDYCNYAEIAKFVALGGFPTLALRPANEALLPDSGDYERNIENKQLL